ncbi:hypothetical protein NCLIV_067130 [Neospora caninum Liverpool]|uniref:Nucleoside-triphosphatase 1 n=1 Tax=Neospora caninum (strain Liverpool) TaxID=572307 RepID=F0VRE0_NEOCL|nr:hypothetical protein NCLIV_067130 [Neospora caninum Liverpool]CBZ56288.1 hypothetical protein NCLIV_067130 [Neospora caninum Liverpool]CEL71051.1 TPA: Nucleoside-triphosphatase 1 [Neospora caninum Liverpool]|eukprot:XP_003886313.1 hypothetical protein NCLIV_067130 [Neospora caninum Liverpool]
MKRFEVVRIFGLLVACVVFPRHGCARAAGTTGQVNVDGREGRVTPVSFEETLEFRPQVEDWLANYSSQKERVRALTQSALTKIREGRQAVHLLKSLETQCRRATQAVIVVDAGSSATSPALFRMQTVSCPLQQRRVLPDSIRHVANGIRHTRLREVLEKWLDHYAGKNWESRTLDSRVMFMFFRDILKTAEDFFRVLGENIVELLEKHLTEEDKVPVKGLGVPVIFYSTGGVRDFQDWYRDGFFVALRHAINNFTNAFHYKLFTNPELTRAITGAEEGLFAFLTFNHLTQRLTDSYHSGVARGRVGRSRNELAALVEIGGASAQVVLPLAPTAVLPFAVKAVNLQRERFLPKRFPNADVISVSFMHLGVDSSTGLFLKQLCTDKEFLKDGICYNPCFFKGYQQACSAGAVTINHEDGTVAVSEDMRTNKLKPIATYCSESNPEISMKAINRLQCRHNKIDPRQPLEKRVAIEGCTKIVGTGDFDKCQQQVESILISPKYPLPANSEATSSGFDSLGQVFRFASTNAPMVITGAAEVVAIRLLMKAGLLSSSFSGDSKEMEEASKKFCGAPLQVQENSGPMMIHLPNLQMKLLSIDHDICKSMAVNVALLRLMEGAEERPVTITWEKSVNDENGEHVADLGWHLGAILQQVLHVDEWGHMVYESGWTHNL